MQESAKALVQTQRQRTELLEQLIAARKEQIEQTEYRRSQAKAHLSVEENRQLQEYIASLSQLDGGRDGWAEVESNVNVLEAAWAQSCNHAALKEKQLDSIKLEVIGLKKTGSELGVELKRSTALASDVEAELSAAVSIARDLERRFLAMSSEVSLCEKRLAAHQGNLDASANFQQQNLTVIQQTIEGVYGRFVISMRYHEKPVVAQPPVRLSLMCVQAAGCGCPY